MNESSYLCIEAHTSTAHDFPPQNIYWKLIPAEGVTGPSND